MSDIRLTRSGKLYRITVFEGVQLEILESKPDMEWVWYDGCGHRHRWTKGKTKHYIKTAKKESVKHRFPRLNDFDELVYDESEFEQLVCRKCGEAVRPEYTEELEVLSEPQPTSVMIELDSDSDYELASCIDVNSEIKEVFGMMQVTSKAVVYCDIESNTPKFEYILEAPSRDVSITD